MIVHFINLNNYLEKDYIAQKCLESWQKNMPNVEIKVWTEKDEFIQKILNKNSKFLKFFQKNKNYGFLCDYLRLHLQYEFGGIYSELDQMLLKPLEIDEDIEFCHSITIRKSITTSNTPNYFKKGNKILKRLIDELDNNFDEYWLHNIENKKFKHPFYGYSEWSLCALRNSISIFKLILELEKNSLKFFEKNINWCLHFCDWWIKYNDKILVIEYDQQFKDYYIENIKDVVYLIFYKDLSSLTNLQTHKCIFINLERKDLYLKFIKYKIFKEPDIKNRIIDVNNYLGDLDNLSEKDFEISINDI